MYPLGSNASEFNNSNPYGPISNTGQQHCPVLMPPYAYGMHQQMSPLGQRPVLFGTGQSSITSPSGSISEFSSSVRSPLSPNMSIAPFVTDDMVYRCNIIAQLQGSYEVNTPEGQTQVSVIVHSKDDGREPYAIVRSSCSDGEFSEKIIHEESDRFTLCSMEGKVEATMMKGSNMKLSVKWNDGGGGAPIVWQRKGEVTFNFFQVESLQTPRQNLVSTITPSKVNSPRRHNLYGVGEALSPSTGSSCGSPAASVHQSIPPGQYYQNYPSAMGPILFNPSCASSASNDNSSSCGQTVSNANNPAVGGWTYDFHNPLGGSDAHCATANLQNSVASASEAKYSEKQEAMVELMKAHCVRRPGLLKRLVHWGMRKAASCSVSSKIADKLCKGRLWVAAFKAEGSIDTSLQENLDDIKGAYQEGNDGVWKQPEPQVSEPGVQHRLRKSPAGQWKIEAFGRGGWQLCAQELPDGRWLDMKNNGEEIIVHLIPMSKILRKLGEAQAQPATSQEVEKCMEFLFKSCNQKKLNSKLKGRNLRHNIDNLKVKLEKQYSLCFAVQVASVADSIAKEEEERRKIKPV